MKKSKYPRLRTHVRKGASGQIWVWYAYDMRPDGGTEISLGKDYPAALEQWHKLHNHIPLSRGRIQEAIDKWRDDVIPTYPVQGTREQYKTYLKKVEAWCGGMAWHEIDLPMLCRYLDARTKKVSANRELSVLALVWRKAIRWGMTKLPWPAEGQKDWKNKEEPRQVEVTDELFEVMYANADQVLKDSMDIATSTGMRITDVRTILMPVDGQLKFRAKKTGKWAYFEVSQSPVLQALVKRREASKAHCVMLLSTSTGRQVTERMLLNAWNRTKVKAIAAQPELAEQLAGIYNRDMRSRAADLATDLGEASKLLQHSSTKLTEDHYRIKPTKLKAVR
jgi:hypothetical protein